MGNKGLLDSGTRGTRWAVIPVLCLMSFGVSGAWAAQDAAASKPSAVAEPAVQYVIEQMESFARPADGALHVEMDVRVRVLTDGETWAPLFGGNVAILSYEVEGGGIFAGKPMVVRRNGEVGVIFKGEDEYQVHLELVTKITAEEEEKAATMPLVKALSVRAEVELPGQSLDITVEPDLPYEVSRIPGGTLLVVYGAAEGSVGFSWRAVAPPRVVAPAIFARLLTVMDITPGSLTSRTTAAYSLLQGEVSEVVLSFPSDCALLDVKGDNIAQWETGEAGPDRKLLKVQFRKAVKDSAVLTFRLQKLLEAGAEGVVELPRIVAENVSREKGVLAISARKDLQVELLEHAGVYQVDASEMPPEVGLEAGQMNLGLRYLRQPYAATIRVAPVQPRISASVLCVTGISTDRMRQSWLIDYEIREAGVFQLKIRLDEGMRLVELRGERVTNESFVEDTHVLTVDLRAKVEGAYRLELHTESVIADPAGFQLPRIEPLGAERHKGVIAISTYGQEAVETAGEPAGISQIDTSELKDMVDIQGLIKARGLRPAVLAFRYLSYPFELALSVSPIQPEVRVEPQHLVEITRKSLSYRSTFSYRIKKAGVFQVQFHLPAELRPGLQVEGEKVEDYSYDAQKQILTVQLTEAVQDAVTVVLVTEKMLDKKLPEPGQTDIFQLPPVYCLGVEQERGYLLLATEESVRLKRAGDRLPQLHDVDVQEVPPALLRAARSPKLAFRVVDSPWALPVEVESILPEITVQIFNYIRFSEGLLTGASTVEFTIKHAGVDEFLVRLPQGVSDPNIKGQNIKVQEKTSEPDDEKGDLWRIELQSEVKGSYYLIFEYSLTLDPDRKERRFTGLSVVGEMPQVRRETGFVAVTADPSLELTPVAEQIESLTPVDEEQIPERFRVLPDSIAEQIGRRTVPILFAFRYLAHPYVLALDSVRHAESAVVTAVVERCKLNTTLTEEGNRLTTMIADVRSRYEHFLSLRLADAVEIWHASVNGRRVRPLEEETGAGRVTKIPISQVQGVQGPVRVEIQWGERGKELGRLSRMTLAAPDLGGVRILRLGWVLQMPEGYSIISDSGALKRVPGSGYFESHLRELAAVKPGASRQRPAVRTSGQAVQSAVEQQKEANVMVLTGRRAREGLGEAGASVPAAQPELPSKFYFQGLILDPVRPAEISVIYMKRAVTLPVTVLVALISVALAAGLWFKTRLSGVTKFVALIAAALVLAGIRLALERQFPLLLATAACSVAGSAVVFAVLAGISSFWRRRGGDSDTMGSGPATM